MVLDFLGRETVAHLDYKNTENLGGIKHKYKPISFDCRELIFLGALLFKRWLTRRLIS